MVNDPLPFQLTVGKLREVLRDVPDQAVVSLRVPAPGIGDEQLEVRYNLRVERAESFLVVLEPLTVNESQATDGTRGKRETKSSTR